MGEEVAGNLRGGGAGVLDSDRCQSSAGDALQSLGLLIDYGGGTGLGGLGYVVVPVAVEARDGDEQAAGAALSGVGGDVGYLQVLSAVSSFCLYTF